MSSKKVVILNQADLLSNLPVDSELGSIKLRNPKTHELSPFLLVPSGQDKCELFELVAYSPETGSLFIDDYVQSECSTFFATRFDFVFSLISMCQMKGGFCSPNALRTKLLKLSETDKDVLDMLVMPGAKLLEKVFDFRLSEEDSGVEISFNQSKCIAWLVGKVNSVEAYLKKSDTEKCGLEAYEIVCQYLDKSLCEPLRKECGLGSPLDTNNSNKMKRAKQEVEVKEEIKLE